MNYVIVPVADVGQGMVDCCVQSSLASLRLSVDANSAVFSYAGEKPACLSEYDTYTHAEIMPIMHSEAWTPADVF